MAILKTSLRIVFLILLCMPIAYIEYYIVKNTAADVMNHGKKKLPKSNNATNSYNGNKYLKVAK